MGLKQEFLRSFEPAEPNDGFDCLLFRLMRRADKDNLKALQKGFPNHYQVHHGWKHFGIDYSPSELVSEKPK